jgi:hypothetical protein
MEFQVVKLNERHSWMKTINNQDDVLSWIASGTLPALATVNLVVSSANSGTEALLEFALDAIAKVCDVQQLTLKSIETDGSSVVKLLASNYPLQRLELSYCRLDDQAFSSIATALEANVYLRVLSFHRCPIGALTYTARQALAKNKALVALSLTAVPDSTYIQSLASALVNNKGLLSLVMSGKLDLGNFASMSVMLAYNKTLMYVDIHAGYNLRLQDVLPYVLRVIEKNQALRDFVLSLAVEGTPWAQVDEAMRRRTSPLTLNIQCRDYVTATAYNHVDISSISNFLEDKVGYTQLLHKFTTPVNVVTAVDILGHVLEQYPKERVRIRELLSAASLSDAAQVTETGRNAWSVVMARAMAPDIDEIDYPGLRDIFEVWTPTYGQEENLDSKDEGETAYVYLGEADSSVRRKVAVGSSALLRQMTSVPGASVDESVAVLSESVTMADVAQVLAPTQESYDGLSCETLLRKLMAAVYMQVWPAVSQLMPYVISKKCVPLIGSTPAGVHLPAVVSSAVPNFGATTLCFKPTRSLKRILEGGP